MMKKTEDAEKVADEIAGVDEENPASKKREYLLVSRPLLLPKKADHAF